MANNHTNTASAERRKQWRYIVSGRVTLQRDCFETFAEMVNFSQGGMLVRGTRGLSAVLCSGSRLTVRVGVSRFPYLFEAQAEVVGGRNDLIALKFLGHPRHLEEMLLWAKMEEGLRTVTQALEPFRLARSINRSD